MTDGDFLPGEPFPSGPVPPEPPHNPWRDDMHTHYQQQPSTQILCSKCYASGPKLRMRPDGSGDMLCDRCFSKEGATGSNWTKCEDGIERPSHYANYPIDPITFAMINELPAWKFQVVKYTCRAGMKGSEEDDIRKAMRHLEMRLELIKRQKDGTVGHVVGRPL